MSPGSVGRSGCRKHPVVEFTKFARVHSPHGDSNSGQLAAASVSTATGSGVTGRIEWDRQSDNRQIIAIFFKCPSDRAVRTAAMRACIIKHFYKDVTSVRFPQERPLPDVQRDSL